MEIALFIQNIQEERAEVALYIFLNNSNAHFDMSEVLSNNNSLGIQERFSKTDRALEECSVEMFFKLKLSYFLFVKTGTFNTNFRRSQPGRTWEHQTLNIYKYFTTDRQVLDQPESHPRGLHRSRGG